MVKKFDDIVFFDSINEAFTYQNENAGALFTNTEGSATIREYNFFVDYCTANGLKGLRAFPYCVAGAESCAYWRIEIKG